MKILLLFIKTYFLFCWLLFSLSAWCFSPAKNQVAASPVFETYEGSGRACAGKLVLSDKTLEWITSFSQCKKQAFQEVDLQETADAKVRVLRIAKPKEKCLYEYVVIENNIKKNIIQVTGYKTLEDQQAHRLDEALSCVVVFDGNGKP